MWNRVNLSEEIVRDILYRLPAKSLGRCKCVSKPWRTLISDPKFIQTHLSLINRKSSLIVVDEGSLFVVEFGSEPPPFGAHGSVSPTRLKFQENHDWYEAFCSFNGLVLAINSRAELFLLNPTTLECKGLPKPRGEFLTDDAVFGFGYDSTTDDYKAVIIFYPVIVYVYRFKSNAWERLQNSPFQLGEAIQYNESGVFLNSSLHWFGEIYPRLSMYGEVSSPSSMITAFDMADEKFRVVPLPSQFDGFNARVVSTLDVVGGSLCIISQENSYQMNGRVDVWIMKEYGVEESWINLSLYQDIGILLTLYTFGAMTNLPWLQARQK